MRPAEPFAFLRRLWRALLDALKDAFDEHRSEIFYGLLGVAGAVVRATGVLVTTGHTAVLFSLGRARRELGPGFHPLIPFLQVAPQIPTRTRTLDLPAQRVATAEGLVYHVDTALVFRVSDATRALVEVDDLDLALMRIAAMTVREVLHGARRRDLADRGRLEEELARRLAARIGTFGVTLERAGFTSITPTPRTIRVTQIVPRVSARERALELLVSRSIAFRRGLGLLGGSARVERRGRALLRLAQRRAADRRIVRSLALEGHARDAIARAALELARVLGEEPDATRELASGGRASLRERLQLPSRAASQGATARPPRTSSDRRP